MCADAFSCGGFVLKVTLCVDLACDCSYRQRNIVDTGSFWWSEPRGMFGPDGKNVNHWAACARVLLEWE